MQRLLIVTRHTPLPWDDGAGAYLHDLAQFLAQDGFRVEILWLTPHELLRRKKIWRLPDSFNAAVQLRLPHSLRCGRYYLFPGIIWYRFKARAVYPARRLLERLRILRPRPPTSESAAAAVAVPARPWMSPPSPAEMSLVDHIAREVRPNIVLASYAWMCPIFALPAFERSRRVCLTHDVAWKRAQLAAPDSPEISRAQESAWLKSANTLIAISEVDAAELRELSPLATVLVAPKACALSSSVPSEPARSVNRLLFVGSANAFNAEGLEWFLQQVWPLIRQTCPDAELDICGGIDRATSLRPESVFFRGTVPDLASYYRDASVVIVPLLRTTGLNIKLIEAAGAGRAIVATSVTLMGAPFLRSSVTAADTPAAFSTAVQLLLTDSVANHAAAAAGLEAVRGHLSPTSCYGPLAESLRSGA